MECALTSQEDMNTVGVRSLIVGHVKIVACKFINTRHCKRHCSVRVTCSNKNCNVHSILGHKSSFRNFGKNVHEMCKEGPRCST